MSLLMKEHTNNNEVALIQNKLESDQVSGDVTWCYSSSLTYERSWLEKRDGEGKGRKK